MSGGGWRAAVGRAGRLLVVVGLALFVAVPPLSDHVTTADTRAAFLQRSGVEGDLRAALDDAFAALDGRHYDSRAAFLGDVDAALDAAEERLGWSIGDYRRGELKQALAREAAVGAVPGREGLFLALTIGLVCLGGLLDFATRFDGGPAGIRNDGVWRSGVKSRGALGILLGGFLIAFYVLLYFHPAWIVDWIRLADPVSRALRGADADRWFFYGFLYTLAVLVMGLRMLAQYRHSRYHVVRTLSVMFFQLGFAFLIPTILFTLNLPEVDLKNAWPLDYDFFYGWNLDALTSSGAFGWFALFWGVALALVVMPLLAFLLGKRWYCSWVCGCGGLAETLGDPYRHLSDTSTRAWRIERWLVHGVLVFAVAMTAVVLTNYLSARGGEPYLGELTWRVQSWYGFLIGSIFAGVVGTGFYPLMGNRVWCRFGCPLAAILGIVQRFRSRFRITTNGGQCISCGNCSTYCEMGIDVRWYAQRGQHLARASCVGCGVCAAVCPRGVLRLENGPADGRFEQVDLLRLAAEGPKAGRKGLS